MEYDTLGSDFMKVAALISEGCDFGGPAPVVYVSGEEVSILLS